MLLRAIRYHQQSRDTRRHLISFKSLLREGEWRCYPDHAHRMGSRSAGLKGEGRRARVFEEAKHRLSARCRLVGTAKNARQHSFQGDFLLRALDRGKTKIFDYGSRRVMTYFGHPAAFRREIVGRQLLSDYIPTSQVSSVDEVQQMVVEDFLPGEEGTFAQIPLLEAAFLDYVERYSKFCKSVAERQELGSLSTVHVAQLRASVERFLPPGQRALVRDWPVPNLEIPATQAHGDLAFYNLIIGPEGWFVVDWEDSSLRTFFYDSVNWIFSEWFNRSNQVFLRRFLQGRYDGQFQSLCRALEWDFDALHKMDYLRIYALERASNTIQIEQECFGEADVSRAVKPLAILREELITKRAS